MEAGSGRDAPQAGAGAYHDGESESDLSRETQPCPICEVSFGQQDLTAAAMVPLYVHFLCGGEMYVSTGRCSEGW